MGHKNVNSFILLEYQPKKYAREFVLNHEKSVEIDIIAKKCERKLKNMRRKLGLKQIESK